MRLVKPNWVKHADDKDRKSPIYSLSVHPDGTRLATGGIDKKVKIWNTLPILDTDADTDEKNHKLLCTMSSHTGGILCVRWAHHGRYLASGSDDTVVMLWGIDAEGGGRVFGSNEVNVESWRPLKRLVGHTADVIDLAWSRDDSMMASVGLDNSVHIWDGATFDRIRKLDVHNEFVKGVCWDPVGMFLATQSDDKTVKIWSTEDWSLVNSVERPFANSPKSTFFRRLSWSPDGAFIAASNAMNGPIFVGQVIEREGWAAEISFVGHANTIEVAAFNPRLFFAEGDEPSRATASCMVALGADDFSISVWRNTAHKPVVVLDHVFNGALYDLCWANDGHHLYGCSEDGTICVAIFDPKEVSEIGDLEKTQIVLDDYGYKPPKRIIPRGPSIAPAGSVSNGFGQTATASKAVNILQPRKKRPGQARPANGGTGLQPPSHGNNAFDTPILPQAGFSGAQASRNSLLAGAANAFGSSNAEAGPSARMTVKRKASDGDGLGTGRNLGPSRLPEGVRDIRPARPNAAGVAFSDITSARRLPLAPIQSTLRQTSPYSGYITAHNATTSQERNTVILTGEAGDKWIDVLPSPVVALCLTDKFAAMGSEDGRLIIYSIFGRRISTLQLDSAVVELNGSKGALAYITSAGTLAVLDVQNGKNVVANRSIHHLLASNYDVAKLIMCPNNTPIIISTEPAAYAFDIALAEWVVVATNPNQTQGVRRGVTGNGLLADVEREVAGLAPSVNGATQNESGMSDDETAAVRLGQMEMRINAARLMGSQVEYRLCLEEYARALRNTDQATELFKGLWTVARGASSTYEAEIQTGIIESVLNIWSSNPQFAREVEVWRQML